LDEAVSMNGERALHWNDPQNISRTMAFSPRDTTLHKKVGTNKRGAFEPNIIWWTLAELVCLYTYSSVPYLSYL
jgi:hypothetical protein